MILFLTHKALGRSAVKSRLTRSGERTPAGSERVVNTVLLRRTPARSLAFISLATWSRPTSRPARRAAFHSFPAL